jgi:hypothetical protein
LVSQLGQLATQTAQQLGPQRARQMEMLLGLLKATMWALTSVTPRAWPLVLPMVVMWVQL